MVSQPEPRPRRNGPSLSSHQPLADPRESGPPPPASPGASGLRWWQRRLLRLLVHDRARPGSWSPVQFVSRRRTSANYRFAAGLARGKHVLDVGAGHGLGMEILLRNGVAELVGVDPSPAINHVAGLTDERLRLIQAPVEEAGLAAAWFDLVTCFAVAYFIPNLPRFLAGIARLVRPGGRLLINSIDPEFLQAVLRIPTAEGDGFAWRPLPVLRTMIEEAGLRIESEWQQTAIPRSHPGPWPRCARAALAGALGSMVLQPALPTDLAFYRLFSVLRVSQP
ncbi:MAG: class I SAM-dependent methyltransferase [Verrucomicrobiales bacterium]|nr:class I SAM-dependent methyltransferase [Verrucomicrobiales bacterium]